MAAKKKKKRTLEQMQKVCQSCKKEKDTTRRRSFKTKDFMGPCADSFCYASCTMSTCREVSMTICDACHKDLAKPEKAA